MISALMAYLDLTDYLENAINFYCERIVYLEFISGRFAVEDNRKINSTF